MCERVVVASKNRYIGWLLSYLVNCSHPFLCALAYSLGLTHVNVQESMQVHKVDKKSYTVDWETFTLKISSCKKISWC